MVGARVLGHAGLDGGAVAVLPAHHADHADAGRPRRRARAKRRLLFASTVGCVGATLALTQAGPGDVWLALVAIVISNYCYCVGESVVAAFLPELARPAALGRVSGWGWSFGYCGGMLTLGLSLVV